MSNYLVFERSIFEEEVAFCCWNTKFEALVNLTRLDKVSLTPQSWFKVSIRFLGSSMLQYPLLLRS